MTTPRRRFIRITLWIVGVFLTIVITLSAWIVVPILTSSPRGSSGQELLVEGFPQRVSATGDDGRTRTLSAELVLGSGRDLSALRVGDRIDVTGSGYSPLGGIYVAVCRVPDSPETKPGPCLGGVPVTTETDAGESDVIEYGASNWVNDDWAWRLFGARSFDDRVSGKFRAFIEIQATALEGLDCREVRCGLYTRSDHTSSDDRVQDLYLPVAFAK